MAKMIGKQSFISRIWASGSTFSASSSYRGRSNLGLFSGSSCTGIIKLFLLHCTLSFYYTMVHKKYQKRPFPSNQNQNSSNLNRICKHLTHKGMVCSYVLYRYLEKNFYSKVTIKGGVKFVKQVSKKLDLWRFSSSMTFFINEDLFLHHNSCWTFYVPMYQCALSCKF